MERQGYGKIVCVGSLAGEIGGIASGPQYVASKGGVHALLKWFARYGGPRGIYANGIAPGVVKTEMIQGLSYSETYCPLGRFAEPEDIAEVALFLASSASNYVTGQILNVDGGHLMH
jgi:3-oxoacyl-[acyl-carrier protein] reductase